MITTEPKKSRLSLKWLAAVVLAVVFVGPALAQEETLPDEQLQMPGTIEGTGTYFEVTDSGYLNIVFQSSEPVQLRLESVPQMVVMHIEAAEGASSTWITLSGFAPSTTYYKYEDDYHNEVPFTTDKNGSYTYAQDLAIPHLVFIQPQASTILIPSDTSVGVAVSGGLNPEEFIILSNYNGISIMLSFSEEGRFGSPDPVYPGNGTPSYGVGMADFDADGDFDFVLGSRYNGNIYYYEKTGPGNSFAAPVIVGTYRGYPLDFAVEDYNRDGNYDFIFTNFGGRAYLFEGHGDGTFASRTFRVPSNCIAADSGDFNNDDIPDFALQSYGSGDAAFYIYLGNGDGTFTPYSFTGVWTTLSWGLTAGDFDGDGNVDILAGGGYYGTSFYLYPGNGDGTFGSGSHVLSLGAANNSPADNYDFNHDGFMDFACLRASERAVYVFFGDGTGSFMPAPENPIYVQTSSPLYGIATPPRQDVLVTIQVDIDIKPGSYPNAVNLGSYGLIPVAILSSAEFDATTVDPETVEFAGAGIEVRGKSGKYMAHEEDVNGDGRLDLVVQVATENLIPGDFQDGYAILTAETFDGELIQGQDEITIVPPE